MYSELELEVAFSMKVPHFGNYLQGEWYFHEKFQEGLSKGEYPEKGTLENKLRHLRIYKLYFDGRYIQDLPKMPINPFEEEQKAWEALSPKIGGLTQKIACFLEDYSSSEISEENAGNLRDIMDEWWQLLQEWNEIAKSAKPLIDAAITHYGKKKLRS